MIDSIQWLLWALFGITLLSLAYACFWTIWNHKWKQTALVTTLLVIAGIPGSAEYLIQGFLTLEFDDGSNAAVDFVFLSVLCAAGLVLIVTLCVGSACIWRFENYLNSMREEI